MFEKELKHAFGKTLALMAFVLMAPLAWVLDMIYFKSGVSLRDYAEFLVFIWWIMTLFAALVLGASGFEQERKDRAFEYLLSLPISKGKILYYKLASRFLILGVLFLFYLAASPFSSVIKRISLFKPVYLILLIFFFTLFSFSFSLFEPKNLIPLLRVSCFLTIGYISILLGKLFKSHQGPINLLEMSPANFFVALSFVSLWCFFGFLLVFRKFDLRPAEVYKWRFILYTAVPVFSAAVVLSLLV